MALVLAQPLFQIEVVVLLAPQQSRQRLAMHPALIFGQRIGRDPLVEFISVGDATVEIRSKPAKGSFFLGGQAQPNSLAAAAGYIEDIVGRGLCPGPGRIDRISLSGDDVGVERILDVG